MKMDETEKPASTRRVCDMPKNTDKAGQSEETHFNQPSQPGTEESNRGQRVRRWSERDRPRPQEQAGATRKRPQLKYLHGMDSNGSCVLRPERGQGQRQRSAEQQLLDRMCGLMGYGRRRRNDRDIIADGLVGYGRGRRDNRDTV